MVRENSDNMIVTCKNCSEQMYPNKGNFDIKIGDYIKIRFEEEDKGEYMWVKVKNIDGDKYEGDLDNDPVLIRNISYGDRVKFTKDDVCDRIRDYIIAV